MKWLSAVAFLGLALSLGAAAPQPSPQSSSSSTSTKKSAKKKHHARREPTQKAPTADRISEIQSALAHGGYYQGDANGKWDSNTVAALQKFQSANGIDADGKLGAPTLQKLGLGSDIAGVSAPKPATAPSCCSTQSVPSPTTQTSAPPKGAAAAVANEPSSQN